jgi:hypothetical protein
LGTWGTWALGTFGLLGDYGSWDTWALGTPGLLGHLGLMGS